jgi:hypothetical protein
MAKDSGTKTNVRTAAKGTGVPIAWKLSMSSHFANTTRNEWKSQMLLTILKKKCFANGYSM